MSGRAYVCCQKKKKKREMNRIWMQMENIKSLSQLVKLNLISKRVNVINKHFNSNFAPIPSSESDFHEIQNK